MYSRLLMPLRSVRPALAVMLAVVLVAGCASDPGSRPPLRVDIPLAASRMNAGQTGRATLLAVGERTQVMIWVSGVPPLLASRPVHLYTFIFAGTCAPPASEPTYTLTQQVLAQSPSSNAIAPAGG